MFTASGGTIQGLLLRPIAQLVLICTLSLLFLGTSYTSYAAETPLAVALSQAASATNSRIVIRTEPLRGNNVDVSINGQKVATLGGNEIYRGVFSPGWVLITTRGGEAKINAEANKEYVFEIDFVGSASGAFFGGLIGSSMNATYPITLKGTSEIEVGHSKPVTEQRSLPRQTSEEIKQPTGQASTGTSQTQSAAYKKLRELEALRKDGILTQQEFDKKKAEILKEM